MAEHLKGDVGLHILAERVHVHEDLLPLVKIAGSRGPGVLAAGAGDGVAAGAAVADGAGFAVGADAVSGGGQNFRISHGKKPPSRWVSLFADCIMKAHKSFVK
jgi:hypothetical protein